MQQLTDTHKTERVAAGRSETERETERARIALLAAGKRVYRYIENTQDVHSASKGRFIRFPDHHPELNKFQTENKTRNSTSELCKLTLMV